MPAMPLSGDAYTNVASLDGTQNTSYDPECLGITKREYFAGLAMQGLLADSYRQGAVSEMGKASVMAADALLKEL